MQFAQTDVALKRVPMLLRQSPIRPHHDGLLALADAIPAASAGLLGALYGAGAPSRVYLLVDASLRRDVAGLFDLDSIDLPATCLFDGEAAEKLAESAPWLVDMSLADVAQPGDLSFHRQFFARHWPVGTSLLIQTDAPLRALRQHLRRFVKLRLREDGQWRFFRFWDPRVLRPFLETISDDPLRLRRMTMTDDGTPLHYVFRDQDADLRVSPVPEALAQVQIMPMALSFADFDPIARSRQAERRQRIADRIQADFATELEYRPRKAIEAAVDHATRHFGGYGFRDHAHLHFFSAWTVFYGPGFESRDPTGQLEDICRSQAPEADRFRAFRKRFDSFDVRAV